MTHSARSLTLAPSARLREFVSHYWLGLNNADDTHTILPDGVVDVVVQVCDVAASTWVYGSTTAQTQIPLVQRCNYVGIRFRPGQSRHFLRASARELTNRCEPAEGLLRVSLEEVPEMLVLGRIAESLNRLLEGYLDQTVPDRHRIDAVIHLIESTHGRVRMGAAAEVFGQSRRQFERVFLETVGVSAKSFATIARFQQAARQITSSPPHSLAQIAAELGYFDQSHMSHEFQRLAGVSPAQFLQKSAVHSVAFLQDPSQDSSHSGVTV